jgi:hypothetical protein
VRASTNCLSARPSAMITCIMEFSKATSVPGLNWTEWVARRCNSVRRGSMTISAVPRLAACFMKVAATGWFSGVLEPMISAASAYWTSPNRFVTAPLPIVSISAATDEAWHRRVQWSTLLVPKTARIIFWKR